MLYDDYNVKIATNGRMTMGSKWKWMITSWAIADKPLLKFHSDLNKYWSYNHDYYVGKSPNLTSICNVINEPKYNITELVTAMVVMIISMVPIDDMAVGVGFWGFCHNHGCFCDCQQCNRTYLDIPKATRLLRISSAILNDAIYSDNDMESVMSNETLEEIMCTYSFSNMSGDGLAWLH